MFKKSNGNLELKNKPGINHNVWNGVDGFKSILKTAGDRITAGKKVNTKLMHRRTKREKKENTENRFENMLDAVKRSNI